jgi:transcription initiation factor IIF auxiliary subunit
MCSLWIIVALSIEQDSSYLGNDRWSWSVHMNGTSAELDNIDHVVYILHSSFHDPVREIRDRATHFRMQTKGWGTFTLYAKVVHRDGHETSLEHDLLLMYPDGKPTLA